MNTIRFFILCLLIGVNSIIFIGCEKYLTIDDVENRALVVDYYDSPQKIEQAVIGMYVDLRRALLNNNAWLMYGDIRAGDLTINMPYAETIAAQRLLDGHPAIMALSDWRYFYDAIHDANETLSIIEKSKDGTLSTYQYRLFKGEVLAAKSLAYFYLLRIWGQVPSAEAADFGQLLSAEELLSRTTQWTAEAQTLLPWLLLNDDGIISASLTEVRFNKTAASLLLAHEQLWMKQGDEAYSSLKSTFENINPDSLSHFGLSLGSDGSLAIPSDPFTGNPQSISMDKFNALYPASDSRRSRFTVGTNGTTATLVIEHPSMLMIYDRREVDLLLAESAWRSGKLEEAKSSLIKAATGATENYTSLTIQTFAEALLKERQRVLIGSGQRFFDLTRFDALSRFIPLYDATALDQGAAYWPLSSESLRISGMQQYSYWRN